MPQPIKYLNAPDVAKRTGRPYNEILELVKTGVLPSHRTHRGHYRLNVDAVEAYFGIQINKLEEEVKKTAPQPAPKPVPKQKAEIPQSKTVSTGKTRLITNESHYEEVIQRICSARKSVKIMTANFKRFNLKPTGSQGNDYKDGTPFIKYLMAKAIQGVSVQIISSMPSLCFTEEWKTYYQQMNPDLFEYKYCERNHAKFVIIDDKIAYVGSANVTPAGLGQGIFTPGNFEAGILTEDSQVVASLNELFSQIKNGSCCKGCHRKRECQERKK